MQVMAAPALHLLNAMAVPATVMVITADILAVMGGMPAAMLAQAMAAEAINTILRPADLLESKRSRRMQSDNNCAARGDIWLI